MAIRIKRVYESPDQADGYRILTDRLWPRGLSRSALKIDLWVRDAAPSNELRRWYGHDPSKWDEFKARYFVELDEDPGVLRAVRERIACGTVTLLFASRELRLNNAAALKEYLERA